MDSLNQRAIKALPEDASVAALGNAAEFAVFAFRAELLRHLLNLLARIDAKLELLSKVIEQAHERIIGERPVASKGQDSQCS